MYKQQADQIKLLRYFPSMISIMLIFGGILEAFRLHHNLKAGLLVFLACYFLALQWSSYSHLLHQTPNFLKIKNKD